MQIVIDISDRMYTTICGRDECECNPLESYIRNGTPLEQEPQSFRWCTDCKEYDQEKHCCHRYSKVIRDTVAEIRQESNTGHWILGGYDDNYYICDKCNYKASEYYFKPRYNFCPNCGVRMVEPQESEDKE